jgi:hypothetical protein
LARPAGVSSLSESVVRADAVVFDDGPEEVLLCAVGRPLDALPEVDLGELREDAFFTALPWKTSSSKSLT